MTKGMFAMNSLLIALVFYLKILSGQLQTGLAKLFKMRIMDTEATFQEILSISHRLSYVSTVLAILSIFVAGALLYSKSWSRGFGAVLLGFALIGLFFAVVPI